MSSAITLAFLIDLTVRGLALVAVAALVNRLLRPRSPAPRHMLWTAVAAGMLALPILTSQLPSLSMPLLPAAEFEFNEPVPTKSLSASVAIPAFGGEVSPSTRSTPLNWIAWIWFAVAGMLLARFAVAALGLSGILARSRPIEDFRLARWQRPGVEIAESREVVVPVSAAWPVSKILLPACWHEWSHWKLESAIEHELSHVRRRDWLAMVISRLNRCLFWFNPFAWWLEREVASLAEWAADDHAAAKLGDRGLYA